MMFKERPIKTVVRNSAKRLLIPYMFFTFMGLVIMHVKNSSWKPTIH